MARRMLASPAVKESWCDKVDDLAEECRNAIALLECKSGGGRVS